MGRTGCRLDTGSVFVVLEEVLQLCFQLFRGEGIDVYDFSITLVIHQLSIMGLVSQDRDSQHWFGVVH